MIKGKIRGWDVIALDTVDEDHVQLDQARRCQNLAIENGSIFTMLIQRVLLPTPARFILSVTGGVAVGYCQGKTGTI